jgi:hypothetical protein
MQFSLKQHTVCFFYIMMSLLYITVLLLRVTQYQFSFPFPNICLLFHASSSLNCCAHILSTFGTNYFFFTSSSSDTFQEHNFFAEESNIQGGNFSFSLLCQRVLVSRRQ